MMGHKCPYLDLLLVKTMHRRLNVCVCVGGGKVGK